jgi:hypothetical protein
MIERITELLNSQKNDVWEMSNIPRRFTGLPADLWVDNDKNRNIQHSRNRIKFQDPDTGVRIPVSVEDSPKVLIKNFQSKLSPKEIKKIFDYVTRNKFYFDKILDVNDGYDVYDFVEEIKTGKII